MADPLQESVQYLKGVGPARVEVLARLGIRTVGDLLFHLPRSFDDLSDIRNVAELTSGKLQTVKGEVVELESKQLPDGRNVLSVVLADARSQCLEGVWFNPYGMIGKFRYGQKLAFSGKPRRFQNRWTMQHPRVQFLDSTRGERGEGDKELAEAVIPIYPLTENLTAEQLRRLLRQSVDRFAHQAVEILPADLRKLREWPDLTKALREVHFPSNLPQALTARKRFIYEEFLVLQVALALRRREHRDRQRAPKLPVTQGIDSHIRKLFPFTLTMDQEKAVRSICKDLAGERPMQRLLQADVGAGKTAVAVYALLVAVANKHQAVMMAPTEILARQHWHTLEHYLAHSRVRRLLLVGGLSARERQQALEKIRLGQVDLVIGTQALIQEDVQFACLGLVVIDEQHKFGVHQRARLRHASTPSQGLEGGSNPLPLSPGERGESLVVDPHYLVMTATPIPRTIALTVFGDLDVTSIKQLPPGRQPVVTRWLQESQRERTFQQMREQAGQGRQAFIVCPLVEESEALDLKAAEKTYLELKEGPFRELRLGLLHGRMSDEDKDRIMQEFRDHRLDILVTTLVIEVGVDVPNATLMAIEHAERFGLSQLHQLRGRISRGTVAGECFLFAGTTTEEARERLKIISRTSDGFRLAEEDARLRGLGEFFGARQHGLGELRFGDFLADAGILQQARADAIELVKEDAGLRKPEHRPLRQAVVQRYGKTLGLPEIG